MKQGLKYLIQKAQSYGIKTHFDQKTIVMPIYSFINQLINSLKGFLNSQDYVYWYCYIVDQFSHQKSISNLIRSWEKLKQTSLECHLLQTLLPINNKHKIKLYLKARKFIVQTSSQNNMIDEVLLNLQDSITVIYKIFEKQQIRKVVIQGIKNIFVAFKVSEAKIYSTVFIEYLLSVYDTVFKLEESEATITEQFNTYKSNKNNSAQFYSSISNFQSSIHQENGLYKKTAFSQISHKKYQIIDRKFLPIQETSQFISHQNRDSLKYPSKARGSHQRSSFYQFVSKTDDYYMQSVSNQGSDFQRANNFYKSNQKRQIYDSSFVDNYKKRYGNSSPTNDKQKIAINNPIIKTNQNQFKRAGSQVSQSVRFIIKDRIQESSIKQNSKQDPGIFSLSNFTKKLFQSSQKSSQRQSLLRALKQQKKKQYTKNNSYERQEQRKYDSTQQLQIQNQLPQMHKQSSQTPKNLTHEIKKQQSRVSSNKDTKNQNSHFYSYEQPEYQTHELDAIKQRQNHQSEHSSKEQLSILISKNQQFKQKMLKKSYSSSDTKNLSQNQQYINKQAIDNNLDKNYNKNKLLYEQENMKDQVYYPQGTFNKFHKQQTAFTFTNNQSLRRSNLAQSNVHIQNGMSRIKKTQQKKSKINQRLNDLQNIRKNDQKLLRSLNNVYKTRKQYRTQQNDFQMPSENHYKHQNEQNQLQQDFERQQISKKSSSQIAFQYGKITQVNQEKQKKFQPLIIHKSISDKKRNLYDNNKPIFRGNQILQQSNYRLSKSKSKQSYQNQRILSDQQSKEDRNKCVNKMKQMIKVIDDYHGNIQVRKPNYSYEDESHQNYQMSRNLQANKDIYHQGSYQNHSRNTNQYSFYDS